MVRGLLYVIAIFSMYCYVVYCLKYIFIFGPWLVRRDFCVPLALLFLDLLIYSCICANFFFELYRDFYLGVFFLSTTFFFGTYGKIWFRNFFPVRGRWILCAVWGGARFEWAVYIMERILYFRGNIRNFSSRIFSCYTVYIIICNLVFCFPNLLLLVFLLCSFILLPVRFNLFLEQYRLLLVSRAREKSDSDELLLLLNVLLCIFFLRFLFLLVMICMNHYVYYRRS